jgi:hypothetical protein
VSGRAAVDARRSVEVPDTWVRNGNGDVVDRARRGSAWGSSHPPRGLTLEEIRANIDSIHIGPR